MSEIPKPMQMRIKSLETDIGYQFKDKYLAIRALTHSSYGDGKKSTSKRDLRDNYERLEFLGDRVLGLLTADRLFALGIGSEGAMARKLNALVRKEACAKVARKANLGAYLLISPSEERQGGRDKTSILGDVCEAMMAAIYLDGGLKEAAKFYDRFWKHELANISNQTTKDPKTELQEQVSANGFNLPEYHVIERTGPDHRPIFIVEVVIDGLGKAQGTGKSKKDAERYAAKHFLDMNLLGQTPSDG